MTAKWQHHISGIHYNGKWLSKSDLLHFDVHEMAQWEQQVFSFLKTWVNKDDFIEVNTSGSTGPPKKIRLNKDSMVASARFTCSFLELDQGDTALLCLPTHFIGGKMMIVRSFVHQLKLTTVEPKAWISISDDYDFVAMTPHQLQSSIHKDQNLHHHLRKLILGGSATPKRLKAQISKWDNQVYSTYGMTETSSHIALQCLNGKQASPFYITIDPSIQLRSDENGRLIIEASYLGKAPIITNDVVDILDHRRFQVLGRLDHVINSGGIKLHPEKIEQKLAHYLNTKFFIYGIPDQQFGERPVLVYEKTVDLPFFKIREACNQILDKLERPEQIIETAQMVLTENGKINRRESYLKAMAK